VIQGTASEATLVALTAGRDRARRALRAGGDDGPLHDRLVCYASTQAHSSVIKAAMIAGLAEGPDDRRRVRLIETDAGLAMDPAALGRALRADVRAGLVPCFVCATVGTTSTTAVDPVDGVAGAIAGCGATTPVWLHVDAAHAGAACVCPEFRWVWRGVERADSVCFNPHKWLLTNFDCDCFFTSDRAALVRALSVSPAYLSNTASESGAVDYRDWQVPLGRRFRALKLWLVLRVFGAERLRGYIREHVRLAAVFEELVRGDERFELAAPRTMNLVCFRLRVPGREESDRANRALMERVNATGRAFLTHTMAPTADGDRLTLRAAVGSVTTREADVRELWGLVAGR
jgi:aromatic-L-amino-acid decarboxylase